MFLNFMNKAYVVGIASVNNQSTESTAGRAYMQIYMYNGC